jgi:hypothetical protein
VLRDCQPLGLVLHHLGCHGDHAWPTPHAPRPKRTRTKCAEGSRNFQTSLEMGVRGEARIVGYVLQSSSADRAESLGL